MQHLTTTDKLLGSPPGATAVLFNVASGVAIRADVNDPYNSFGSTVRHVGPVLPEFMDTLEHWIDELQRLAARKLDAVVACSVWRRAKEGERINRHAEGKAIDIGGVWFDRRDGVTAWDYGTRRKLAVGVEATLRLHFGTVLGPTSNKDHDNHWHADIGRIPEIFADELHQSKRGVRKVEIVYVQDACTTVRNIPLKLDGIWGPKTEAAVHQVLAGLNLGDRPDITIPEVYRAFNVATALVAFGHVEAIE